MAKRQVQTEVPAECPNCHRKFQQEALAEFDIPEPTAPNIPNAGEIAVEVTKALAPHQEQLQDLQAQLEEAQRAALTWEHAPSTMDMSKLMSGWQECPNCKSNVETFLGGLKQDAIKNLSETDLKGIARSQGWWPPADISIPFDLSTKSMRR